MLSNAYQIVSHGEHLSLVGQWGDVVRRDRAEGGCWELTWHMELPPGFHHRALRRGSRVDLRMAGTPIFTGEMAEPDRSEGLFVARGLSRLAEGYLALKADGTTTSVPNTAIDQAIATGLPWKRPANISATAVTAGDTTEGVNYLHTLLDAHSDANGSRWGVDAHGIVYDRRDSAITSPRWYCTPGSAYLGISDEDYASHLIGRYRVSTTSYATTTVGNTATANRWGYRAVPVDLTARGVLSTAAAQEHLTNLLAKVGPRPGWANGIEVARNELTSAGGVAANFGTVRGGQKVRLFGVFDENLQPIPYIDFVIGELVHGVGADTIQLNPVGMAERSLSDVIASAANPSGYKG